MKKLSKQKLNPDSLLLQLFLLNLIVIFVSVVFLKNTEVIKQILNEKFGDFYYNFFNSLYSSKFEAPYAEKNTLVYTPFCLLLSKALNIFIPNRGDYLNPKQYAAAQSGRMLFFVFIALSILLIWLCISSLNAKNRKKYFALVIVVLSYPIIYSIGMGSFSLLVLALCLFFVLFYDSDVSVLKELALIALAIAAAIKVYPVVLILLMLKKENKSSIIKTALYFLILFFIPYLFFNDCPDLLSLFSHIGSNKGSAILTTDDIAKRSDVSAIILTFSKIIFNGSVNITFINSISKYIRCILIVWFLFGGIILNERWKKTLSLCFVMLSIPTYFGIDNTVLFLIPSILFIFSKDFKNKKTGYIYAILLFLLNSPLCFSVNGYSNIKIVLMNITIVLIMLIVSFDIISICLHKSKDNEEINTYEIKLYAKGHPAVKASKYINWYIAVFSVSLIVDIVALIINKFSFGNDSELFGMFYGGGNIFDTYMDYFNSVNFSLADNPYDFFEAGAIYPPICYLIYFCFSAFIPVKNVDASLIRASVYGNVQYIVLTVLLLIALVLILTHDKRYSSYQRAFISLTVILSYPILYVVERGNFLLISIVLCSYFIMFRNSDNKIRRELALIALALAAAIKIYPAIFGLILLFDKTKNNKTDWCKVIRCVIYGIVLFVLPFFFYSGIDTVKDFISSLTSGAQSTVIVENGDIGRVDLATTVYYLVNTLLKMDLSLTEIEGISGVIKIGLVLLQFIGIFVLKQEWKKLLCMSNLCLIFTTFCYAYSISVIIIPIFVMLAYEKKYNAVNWIYFLSFMLILIDMPFVYNTRVVNFALIIIYAVILLDVIFTIINTAKNKKQNKNTA